MRKAIEEVSKGEEYEEQQHLMEAELELLTEERSQLILEDEKAKGELRERWRMFEEDIAEWYKKTEDNEWLMKVGGGTFFK